MDLCFLVLRMRVLPKEQPGSFSSKKWGVDNGMVHLSLVLLCVAGKGGQAGSCVSVSFMGQGLGWAWFHQLYCLGALSLGTWFTQSLGLSGRLLSPVQKVVA